MKFSMTRIPPAETEEWYHPARACRYCRAKVMNRVEAEDGVKLRVLHEDPCSRVVMQAVGSRRGVDRADLSGRKSRTSPASAPTCLKEVI
jgi:hypothetical protein